MVVDFCLPVRNEEKILQANLQRLQDFLLSHRFPFTWQVTIVINGSSDSSLAIARRFSGDDARFKVISLESGGKGRALRAGFEASQADLIVFMDIDLAVSLDNIPDLLQPLLSNHQDLVFGSRLLTGANTQRSFIRTLSSRTYNFLSRLILNHHFFDLQCGFKAMRRGVFSKVAPYLQDQHWFFDTELIVLAQRCGYRLLEIPVNWQENRYDKRASKIRLLRDGYRFIKRLLEFNWRLRKITFF